jgi:inosine/xanthosine triphosphate pyrophosphatase family protein
VTPEALEALFEKKIEGFGETFAELGAETKNRLSHRGRALAGLKSWPGWVR